MENKILNISFSDRSGYDQISPYIREGDFVGAGEILWDEIEEYYNNDKEAKSCDRDIILSRIERGYPKAFPLLKDVVLGFTELSVPNVVKEVCEFKRHQISLELSNALLSKKDARVRELIQEYQDYDVGVLEEGEAEGHEIFSKVSIADLIQPAKRENLIRLYPLSLNERVDGGVPAGTAIAIYARPEMGKSLFSINMAAGFCRDGHKTLYIGNEDPASQMMVRFVSRMSGMNKYQVIESPQEAEARAYEKGYGNLVFASLAPGTIKEIENLIITHEPKILVVDQVRNLNVGKEEGLVQVLEKASSQIRTLGKKYNLVNVQVTQAGDSATNKLVLAQNDVDSSKTGFPAQFDLMIGVGANLEYESRNRRMMSLTKNKISADHSHFPVEIDPTISKVISI